jgi:hypothetical protein
MFHCSKHCILIFPRHRKFTGRAGGVSAAGQVDSNGHLHRMSVTCRPEKAARFVWHVLFLRAGCFFSCWLSMRNARAAAGLTFSDRHDQERDVASASGIRQG